VSDLVVLMAQDHRSITETCAVLQAASGRGIGPLVRRLVDQLRRHEIAEEAVFYPELIAVAGGEIVAERLVSEHRLWEDLMDLEAMTSSPEGSRSHLSPRRLSSSVQRHLETEEGIAFPLIVTGVHRSRLHALGARYAKIREAPLGLRFSYVSDGPKVAL
jgi:iron-sulfur cluster repair protein YtfE (RIC family)